MRSWAGPFNLSPSFLIYKADVETHCFYPSKLPEHLWDKVLWTS